MSEQELIDAVTTRLTGKLYVGQRVRIHPNAVWRAKQMDFPLSNFSGTIVALAPREGRPDSLITIRRDNGDVVENYGYEWFTGEIIR